MRDPRLETLAANLLDYSLDLKPGEKVLIGGESGSRPHDRFGGGGLPAECHAVCSSG